MELLYNPELMPSHELDSTFVDRQGARVADLISFIESQPGEGRPRHALIIGQRGMGKTTLQLKLRSSINESDLRQRWLPLKFPEELFGVSDLADLLVHIVALLSEETGDEKLKREMDELAAPTVGDKALESGALKLLDGWHRKHGKRLLLLIENLDQLINQFSDEKSTLRLTSVLKDSLIMLVVATAVAPLEDEAGASAKFSKLFQTFHLTHLDSQEIREVLLRRAKVEGVVGFEKTLQANDTRLRALEYFTGGIPRLVLMLYQVLTQSDVREVRRGLEKLLDQVTPYYKAKVESLPPQQRKILDHLARSTSRTLQGVTPTDVAAATRLTQNQVSTQLRRLACLGYVRVADSQGRNNYYTLSEPLYAIWHRMRLGRDERQRMRWLVDFVKAWYDSREIGVQSARLMIQLDEALKAGELREAFVMLDHMSIFKDAMDESPAYDHAEFQIADGRWKLYESMETWLSDLELEVLDEDLSKGLRNVFRTVRFSIPAELFKSKFRKLQKREADLENTVGRLSGAEKALWRKYAYSSYKSIFEHQHEEALNVLKELESTDFDRDMLWYGFGNVLEALGRYEEAIEYYQRSLSLRPESTHTLVSLGQLLQRSGRHEEAYECFSRTTVLDSEFDEAWYGLGYELCQLGRHEEAIKCLDRALAINPFLYKAWFYRGLSLQELGKYEEALEDYDRLLQINPKAAEALNNRGWLLEELGRHEEALESLEKSLEIDPEKDSAWYLRGVVLIHLKRYEEALCSFDKAAQLAPETVDPWVNRGWVLLIQDKYEEAITSFDHALRIDPDCVEAWWDRGLCLYELSRYEESVDSISQAIRLSPKDARHHLYLGLSLYWLKRYEEALPSFSTAASLDPRLLRARLWRSLAYFNLGRYEDALDSFDDLLSAETDDPNAWLIRPYARIFKFEVLAWTGKTNEALDEWNLGFSLWGRELAEGRGTEEDRRNWFSVLSRILTALAGRRELREFVRRHISQFGLEEQMLPLARALDFLLSGDSSFVDRLSPEVKGVTQDIINKLQGAGDAEEECAPQLEPGKGF